MISNHQLFSKVINLRTLLRVMKTAKKFKFMYIPLTNNDNKEDLDQYSCRQRTRLQSFFSVPNICPNLIHCHKLYTPRTKEALKSERKSNYSSQNSSHNATRNIVNDLSTIIQRKKERIKCRCLCDRAQWLAVETCKRCPPIRSSKGGKWHKTKRDREGEGDTQKERERERERERGRKWNRKEKKR